MLAAGESARGVGTVQVDGDTKPIQHPKGGVVAEIFVESGDVVVEGAALLQLDVTQLLAEQRATNGQFWAMRRKLIVLMKVSEMEPRPLTSQKR